MTPQKKSAAGSWMLALALAALGVTIGLAFLVR